MTAAAEIIAAPTRAPPRPWGLEGRYRLALLSMAATDLVLSAVFLSLSGKPGLLLWRLPEVAVFLGALMLAGGHVLFAPIRHFVRTGEGRRAARTRAARLGTLTARWAIAVSMLFTVWSFLIAPFAIYGVEPSREVAFILLGRALAWVVLLPYVAVFTMQEYLRTMRRDLFERYGVLVPPGTGRLGRKLALVLLGGAVVPGASIAVTLLLVPEISPITGQPRSVVVVTTLVGAALALGLAFWATQRSTTAALDALLDGMKRAEAGDLGVAIPVGTEDELGRLGEGFNALTRALAESRFETRRKEAERAHAAARFHEAQKREALGRLAAGVSHDFNNILGIVTMYAAMVRKDCAGDAVATGRLDEVLTAAGRGRDLVARILDFARDRPTGYARVDLAGHIRETMAMLRPTLLRDIALDLDLPPDPLIVTGDATGLHQVATNLVINAAHAMAPEDGHLHVSLSRMTVTGERATALRERLEGGATLAVYEEGADGRSSALLGVLTPGLHARLTVRDDGTGMTPETLRSIFNPYFTTKEVGEGTGLGLAAVAGIVEAHGGGIHVRTRVGEGTRFDIFLPCTGEE